MCGSHNILFQIVLLIHILDTVYGFKGGQALPDNHHTQLFQAMVEYDAKDLCTGSFISSNRVISASTCLCPGSYDLKLSKIAVNYGKARLGNCISTEVSRIKCPTIKPPFYSNEPIFDIGIIELKKSIEPSKEFHPISLLRANEETSNCKLYGWDAEQLNVINNVHIITRNECRKQISFDLPIDILCSYIPSNNFKPLNTDAGAPLVCNGKLLGLYLWKNPTIKHDGILFYTNLMLHYKSLIYK